MMRVVRSASVRVLVFLSIFLQVSLFVYADFSSSPDVGERFLDIRSFAFKIASQHGWSLIISNDVTSPLKEVKGETIEEALSNYFKNTPFGWRYFENCLYVANERELNRFFSLLPELEMSLPKGKDGAFFNGIFKRIELSVLCQLLKAISGVEIRTASGLESNIMMRARNMNWQRVLLSVSFLNRFQVDKTDFSVIISPEHQ
ncbi:MAG: hypothetical protein PHD82_02165 [Candidatus Riflebacteria bacterium]|nr:hypothetical protein [Candidatus Riflebacteria bacterium]